MEKINQVRFSIKFKVRTGRNDEYDILLVFVSSVLLRYVLTEFIEILDWKNTT